MIIEGDVCNQYKRNNYGNSDENYSNNNAIDDDCMKIKGQFEVNLEKDMLATSYNIDKEDQQESQDKVYLEEDELGEL